MLFDLFVWMWWLIFLCIFLVRNGNGGLNKLCGGIKFGIKLGGGILGKLKLLGIIWGDGFILGIVVFGFKLCLGVIFWIGVVLWFGRKVWMGFIFWKCIGFILWSGIIGCGGIGNGGSIGLIGVGIIGGGWGFLLRWIVLGECIVLGWRGNCFFRLIGVIWCGNGLIVLGKICLLCKLFNNCICWSWMGRNNFFMDLCCFWRFLLIFWRFCNMVLKGVGFYIWIVFSGWGFLSWFFIIVEVVIICNGFVGCGSEVDLCEILCWNVLLFLEWLFFCLIFLGVLL